VAAPLKPNVRPTTLGGTPTPQGEDSIQKSRREKDELQRDVQSIEEELEALKAKYEAYFLGIERREPSRWRDEVKKKVARVKTAFTRNAGLRFRIQALNARALAYERLWVRSVREKEEGTYRRDVFKARLRRRGEKPANDAASGKASGAAATPAAPTAPQPAVPARASATPPPAKPAPPAGAVSEPQLRALYDAYVAAKKSCNEDVSKLTYDAVAKSVAKQVPELITRYKAKTVEFKVEVKDGRAILKAIPKS
jgi:hypothetical protein